uniref:EF-hand domain-containing protein n=1 Tax=Timema bartmani TaxID=61472 RepID=A0A7R9EVS7_9NEOP|nr:unnamed protein product [Timema bartmani]
MSQISYLFCFTVLRKAFDAFDREKSGSISCNMVEEILRLMGQPFNKKTLEELIEEVDADKSGRLEFDEFITLAAKFIVEEDAEAMEKELREAFRLYDKEGNGYIPTSCLREILRELDDQLTSDELDMMIEEIDSDGSGTVDFDGLVQGALSHFVTSDGSTLDHVIANAIIEDQHSCSTQQQWWRNKAQAQEIIETNTRLRFTRQQWWRNKAQAQGIIETNTRALLGSSGGETRHKHRKS